MLYGIMFTFLVVTKYKSDMIKPSQTIKSTNPDVAGKSVADKSIADKSIADKIPAIIKSPYTEGSPIVVAMDFESAEPCVALAKTLSPKYCRLKVGKELFTAAGPQLIEQLMGLGFEIFLDLKFHDIPSTVAKAVKAASKLGIWMVNVHASGGEAMLVAAKEAIDQHASPANKPILIAVTVLTSMTADDLKGIGCDATPQEQVLRLATLTKKAGLDGVVCSALEAAALKDTFGRGFCLVTPGIRPAGSATDDQKRIVTPTDAIKNGSDYLVIGRPITQAKDPAAMCESIYKDLVSL
jgi:orotidine-5'-phosphate decarboxylase